MAEEKFELPSSYIQILCVGGWIAEVNEEIGLSLQAQVKKGAACVEFEDLYGSNVLLQASLITGFVCLTEDAARRYAESHPEYEGR